MRVKTSITLPEDLLKDIDRLEANRSVFLERAARHYLTLMSKRAREARDRAILDEQADRLNREAAEVLDYQKLPE